MDAEGLRRELLGLKPCVVFHDIGPETLAEIRAAAQPQPPAPRIEVHPYYLEAGHRARQQLQDYLDDAMREHVLRRIADYGEAMRRIYGDGES